MRRGLAREWRRWLIENLLLGIQPRELTRTLVQAGLSRAEARAAIDREAGDPCLAGGFRATSMQRKLEGLMDAYGDLHRQAPWHQEVERRGALAPRELLQRYALRCRPLSARDALPALTSSVALRLEAPALWLDAPGSRSLRRAETDLLLYQVLGRRPLVLVPWCDLVAVQGRTGDRPALEEALQLGVAVEAGEALLIPVGWWYR